MKKIVLLTAICMQFVFSGTHAQINSSIPLMVQPLQLQNPMQQMQQMEQIRAMQIQNQMLEDQRRAQQLQNQQRQETRRQQSQPVDPIIDEWLKAAAPRMGLYPDFEKVVFAPDVSITPDMIRLMTPSPLAADIAYYLGSNKIESLAISKMNLVEAARSIDRIESKLKAGKLP